MRAGDAIVGFAITAAAHPTSLSMSLRGELLAPWRDVAGIQGFHIEVATLVLGYSGVCNCMNEFLLDANIQFTETLSVQATVFYSLNAGDFGQYLLAAKTSRITLGDIWTFVERCAGRSPLVAGVTAEKINAIAAGTYLDVEIYVAPTEVTVERQGETRLYPRGFEFYMHANLFGIYIDIEARLLEKEHYTGGKYWDAGFSLLMENAASDEINLILLPPLGLAQVLIGGIRDALPKEGKIVSAPGLHTVHKC